ncbi:hypothetical protein ABEB36_012791 [Hypothenemus hampei]|uniref:Uncharacterized protein n=1 Tax=Hypothenemus hampei TaxID=57062 RepID=A0ABD1E5S8_HYPHA
MADPSRLENLYIRHQLKRKKLSSRIWFLTSCKRCKVYPNFIQNNLKINTINNINYQKTIKSAKTKWLNYEIREAYNQRDENNIKLYDIYKKLAYQIKGLEDQDGIKYNKFDLMERKVRDRVSYEDFKF